MQLLIQRHFQLLRGYYGVNLHHKHFNFPDWGPIKQYSATSLNRASVIQNPL